MVAKVDAVSGILSQVNTETSGTIERLKYQLINNTIPKELTLVSTSSAIALQIILTTQIELLYNLTKPNMINS